MIACSSEYKIFVSHGSADLWLAGQIAKELSAHGATPFLDAANIPKAAPNFKETIRKEIARSKELVALFTPWSKLRSWVWIEMGAAWSLEIPILAIFYGMDLDDLDKSGQGRAILEDINVCNINDVDVYLHEMSERTLRGDQ